jgi:alcohol dehydrogenase
MSLSRQSASRRRSSCATELVRPGGRVANVGVHGQPATLHLEKLWIRDVTLMTGLVDTFTTPRLMKLIDEGRLDPSPFATHRFDLDELEQAYDTFADAASTDALKVVLSAHPVQLEGAHQEAAFAGSEA